MPRDTYYGFVNRDFQRTQQDIATVNGEYQINDFVTVEQQIPRRTLGAELYRHHSRAGNGSNGSCNSSGGNFASPNPAGWTVCLNPLSRYQVTDVLADQTVRDDQVRHRTGAQHGGDRHRSFARGREHRQLQRA